MSPRSAIVRATFDGSDPKTGQVVGPEIDAPAGATKLRVVAEISGHFSEEESAPLTGGADDGVGKPKVALKPDAPVTMTSRFEPKDTAAAFSALDRLAKTVGTQVLGGSIEVTGGRLAGDYLTLRVGQDVKIGTAELDTLVKALVSTLNASTPTVKLRLDGIAFPSGRELTDFCDASGEDFDRVTWTQE